MAKVTSIERLPRGGRVAVFADGQEWAVVGREAILICGVRAGDEASPELFDRLRLEDERHRAYEAALMLLRFRIRSREELRGRLTRKGFGPSTIEATLDRLVAARLVNDEEFARAWVANRASGTSARGRSLLHAELRGKGLSNELIADATSTVDENAEALTAARPRAERLRGCDFRTFRLKIGGFLQRRGFGYDAVGFAVRSLWQENQESRTEADGGDATYDQ
jgi:regulatory protein